MSNGTFSRGSDISASAVKAFIPDVSVLPVADAGRSVPADFQILAGACSERKTDMITIGGFAAKPVNRRALLVIAGMSVPGLCNGVIRRGIISVKEHHGPVVMPSTLDARN